MCDEVVVFVIEDERWPFYYISEELGKASYCDYALKLTKEEWEFVKKAMEDFEKAQEFIKKKIKERKGGDTDGEG